MLEELADAIYDQALLNKDEKRFAALWRPLSKEQRDWIVKYFNYDLGMSKEQEEWFNQIR